MAATEFYVQAGFEDPKVRFAAVTSADGWWQWHIQERVRIKGLYVSCYNDAVAGTLSVHVFATSPKGGGEARDMFALQLPFAPAAGSLASHERWYRYCFVLENGSVIEADVNGAGNGHADVYVEYEVLQ